MPGEAVSETDGILEARFAQTLPAGPAELIIRWRRGLTEAPKGVYRLRREDAWFAFTRFEPAFARTAMPCFDQPDFKAPWALTLRVPKGELAVANRRGGWRAKSTKTPSTPSSEVPDIRPM